MSGESEPWILLGRAMRAHGVKGELRFGPTSPDASTLIAPDLELKVVTRDGAERHVTVGDTVRHIHDAVLFTIRELPQREDVQQLAGAQVLIQKEAIDLDDDPFLFELEGAEVVDELGTHYGVVESVADNGGQDLLVIASSEGERLLPLVDETFVEFDRVSSRLVIRPIPGLWDA